VRRTHVTPLSLVPSLDCAYFPSPRRWHPPCPSSLNSASTQLSLCLSVNSMLSAVCRLLLALCALCALFALPFFVFNSLQPLLRKRAFCIPSAPTGHPGWGGTPAARCSDVQTWRRSDVQMRLLHPECIYGTFRRDVPKKQKPRLATGLLP
jgi:hypothetical protein